jgi:hypothetical protein
VIVVGLVVYLSVVGLDKADKLSSSIGGVVALGALLAPYLLRSRMGDVVDSDDTVDEIAVTDSGEAEATGGGAANTGVETSEDTGSIRVNRSGKAVAKGPDSVANSGVRRLPRS